MGGDLFADEIAREHFARRFDPFPIETIEVTCRADLECTDTTAQRRIRSRLIEVVCCGRSADQRSREWGRASKSDRVADAEHARGVDADDFSVDADEWPARIAPGERGVGLNDTFLEL